MASDRNDIAIVFIEFIDEAQAFLSEYGAALDDAKISIIVISLHPLVKSFLTDRNIDCIDSFQLCGKENHRKLITILQSFTDQVRSKCQMMDCNGIRLTYTEDLIFYLRTMLSHILYRIEVIAMAIAKYRPDKIISIGTHKILVARSLFIESGERYVDAINDQLAKMHHIDLERLIVTPSAKPSASLSPVRNMMKEVLDNIVGVAAALRVKRGKKLVIAPSQSFQMGKLLRRFRQQYGKEVQCGVMSLDLKTAAKMAVQQIWGIPDDIVYIPVKTPFGFLHDKEFRTTKAAFNKTFYSIIKKWKYRGVFLEAFVKKKYKIGLEPLVINAARKYSSSVRAYLERWRPDFIFAQYARRMPAVLGELASLSGIASMIIPHGTFVPSTDDYSRMEWKENALGIVDTAYGSVALQTPLIEEFIRENDIDKPMEITGPLLFGLPKQKSKNTQRMRQSFCEKGEKIILHAGTPKIRRGTRLLNYETIDEYVDGIASLVKAAQHCRNIHLIIRYREVDGLDQSTLQRLLPQGGHYSIASDGDFQDYLAITNLLVSFSSTTIEEALQNDIPVMLYNKYGRYVHIDGTVLAEKQGKNFKPSAIYNINDESDLLFGLRWIIDNHLNKDLQLRSLFARYKYRLSETRNLADIVDKGILKNHSAICTTNPN